MKLRTKLLLAQLPLVIALGITIVVGSLVTRALGRSSQDILKDNYRSVLAAARMKEAAERVDSGVVFTIIRRVVLGIEQVSANIPKFENELRAQEANITEPGEHDATIALRTAWTNYQAQLDEVKKSPDAIGLDERYFTTLLPDFLAVKSAADKVLTLNQDAMIHKSDVAQRVAGQWDTMLVLVSSAGLNPRLVGLDGHDVAVAASARCPRANCAATR